MLKPKTCFCLIALFPLFLNHSAAQERRSVPSYGYDEWKAYGGGAEGIRYSTLRQITPANARQLQTAWTYDTGDSFPGSEMQCNPLIVDGVLYATTPKLRVIALDAATGRLRWSFNPFEGRKVFSTIRNRGLTYWSQGNDRRIFVVANRYLYALDARTGKPVAGFGKAGRVDLREGLGRDPETLTISATTPGIVYKNLLILGSIVSEDLPAAPGDIRAYDTRSGKLTWAFRTIPRPGEKGYETWPADTWKYTGGVNNWCGMALDEKRGLVFVPTGSAAFDFYGSDRVGDNLFANCLLALNAATGERVWHFQFVRHDVWDRDLPSPPSLVTVERDGRLIDAVAQTTKSGHVFVFERETGKPLFPIEERSVRQSDVDGEVLATKQPFPLKPPPFARQLFTEDLVTKPTPEAHEAVLAQLRKARNEGQFAPPSKEGTVIFPGFDGGAEWGGSAFDPETGLLYVNSNEMAWILRLVPRPKAQPSAGGRALYLQHCASCHREDLRGNPPAFPSLVEIGAKYEEDDLITLIRQGSGRMPGYGRLGKAAVGAITDYLISGRDTQVVTSAAVPSFPELKYTIDGYNKFLDPDRYPAVEPPWGTLNAINLDSGEIAWKVPFGEIPALVAKGLKNTGSENYGGPLVTAGGVLFIGATCYDKKFHVFDKRTGELLWETELPASANATPATYEVNGRQFVVTAAGGGKGGSPSGGTYVAFALPK